MSLAWETTEDDILNVLRLHKKEDKATLELAKDALDGDEDRIEEAALYYDEMEAQTAGAYNEIEDILMEAGVLSGQKLCMAPQ
jgi:hypothetical protein